MQRRDVETEDKGGALDEAQHPASIETSAPRMQPAHCSLPVVCRLQQMRRFPNCRFFFPPLALGSCSSSLVALPTWPPGRLAAWPPGPSSLLSSVILQLQHIGCQHGPQTLPRSSDWPSMPSQEHNSSMRLLIRRSANNQRGG
jgi:hypothetical protein